MRYKDGTIPPDQLTTNASNDMLLLTAILGMFIGITLIILGRKGHQMWMWVWGIGLVIISLYMGISLTYNIKLFGYF